VKDSDWPIVPKNAPFDYFHINAVDTEPNGNLLVSSRNTHALYEIDRTTGKIVWRLGGKHSDFAIAKNARFEWQHDARRQPNGTITVFDNGATPRVEKYSRVLVLRVDEATHRVTLVRSYRHPRRLSSSWEGNAQFLPNGHVFVGWGSNPDFTEFDDRGRVVLDGSFGRQGGKPETEAESYRAYRFAWTAHPTDRPSVKVSGGRLYVSWNGATEVARWQVLTAPAGHTLQPSRTVPKRGFETAIALTSSARVVAVRALDAAGNILGTSRTVKR
jgi:Arylsulfotransferase (ASST)